MNQDDIPALRYVPETVARLHGVPIIAREGNDGMGLLAVQAQADAARSVADLYDDPAAAWGQEPDIAVTLTAREQHTLLAALVRYEHESGNDGFGSNAIHAGELLARVRAVIARAKGEGA